MGVLTLVGWVELTRILRGPSSLAKVFGKPVTPCFAAAYRESESMVLSSATELIKTIEPPRPPSMTCGDA